jgi:hypothetical protein
MKEYLKNNICNFTPLFDIDYKKKKNIISCCFFKMKEGGYKDFEKYTNGLKSLDSQTYLFNNYRIRLFIDKSIYEDKNIMNILNNLKNTDLVLYSCPNYIVDDIYHKGLFGTIIRFFPLFNFPNNDSNSVFVCDIDYDMIFLKLFNIMNKNVKQFKNNKTKIYFHHFAASETTWEHTSWFKSNIRKKYLTPYVAAGVVLGIEKLDYKYLETPLKNNDKEYQNFFKLLGNIKKEKKLKEWAFGVDEYYLNKTLTDLLIKNKEPFTTSLSSIYILKNLYNNIIFKKQNYDIYETFFKIILNDEQDFKFTSIKKAFEYIDNLIYPIIKNKSTKIIPLKIINIIYNIYEYYIINYNNPDIKYFDKEFIDIILNDALLGLFYIKNILIGYNKKGIKNYIDFNLSLPHNYIDKLKKLKKELNIKTLELKIPKNNIYNKFKKKSNKKNKHFKKQSKKKK